MTPGERQILWEGISRKNRERDELIRIISESIAAALK